MVVAAPRPVCRPRVRRFSRVAPDRTSLRGPRCGLRCEVSLSIAWRGGPMVVVTAPDQFVSALSFVTLCLYKSVKCAVP